MAKGQEKQDTKSMSLRMPQRLYNDVEEWKDAFHWQNMNSLLVHLIDLGLRTERIAYRHVLGSEGIDEAEESAASLKRAGVGG